MAIIGLSKKLGGLTPTPPLSSDHITYIKKILEQLRQYLRFQAAKPALLSNFIAVYYNSMPLLLKTTQGILNVHDFKDKMTQITKPLLPLILLIKCQIDQSVMEAVNTSKCYYNLSSIANFSRHATKYFNVKHDLTAINLSSLMRLNNH